jgi:hypothetical protein
MQYKMIKKLDQKRIIVIIEKKQNGIKKENYTTSQMLKYILF